MITRSGAIMQVDWTASPEYTKALELLERGEWSDAASTLQPLIEEYPNDPTLQTLLAETELRREAEQAQQASQRRLILPNRRIVYVFVLVAVLVALAWLAQSFYKAVIVPSMTTAQEATQQEAIASEARQALAAGDYVRALDTYDKLAELNPKHPDLAKGVREAEDALDLSARYDQAQQQLADGQYTEAQATLVGIQAQAPKYRDVNTLLAKIERRQRLTGLLRQAGDAMDAANWDEAVARLEEARALSSQEDQDAIASDLFQCYVVYARQIVSQSHGNPPEVKRALGLYNKALSLQPQESQTATQRQWAQQYLDGYDAFTGGRWDEAIAQLEPLYAAQPAYVDHKAAQLLYDAYVHSAEELLKNGNPTLAWERYFRASQMKGVDTTGAKTLAATLAKNMTPTPVPTITPTPRPVVLSAPTVPAGPVISPPSAVASLSNQTGKIAFVRVISGTRDIWIMSGEGGDPVRLQNQDQARADYDRLRNSELKSPDGNSSVVVFQAQGDSAPQIYVAKSSGGYTRVTNLSGQCYDPVWSPTGHWIAFVSNSVGNDEIYVVGADGQNQKRLTYNTWEWDKHPSWSADGNQMVFWSNRGSGWGQIWRMNADGTVPVNLSKNGFDEQDPIWLK